MPLIIIIIISNETGRVRRPSVGLFPLDLFNQVTYDIEFLHVYGS